MFLFQPMLSVSYWPVDSTSSLSSISAGEFSTEVSSGGEGVKNRPQIQRFTKNRIPSGMRLQRSRKVAAKEYEQSLNKSIRWCLGRVDADHLNITFAI